MIVNANQSIKKGDTIAAIKTAREALAYRGSFNEKQYGSIFSDGNDYNDHKLKQITHYAQLYEMVDMPDSAMAALAGGMMFDGRYDYALEKYFFRLAVRKFGRDSMRHMLISGLNDIRPFAGAHHDPYSISFYYTFSRFKLPLKESDTTNARVNKAVLLKSLYEQYGLN